MHERLLKDERWESHKESKERRQETERRYVSE